MLLIRKLMWERWLVSRGVKEVKEEVVEVVIVLAGEEFTITMNQKWIMYWLLEVWKEWSCCSLWRENDDTEVSKNGSWEDES